MDEKNFSKIYETFMEEAEEQLQKIEQEILKLEKKPEDYEALNEVFRMAHSLKGSTGLLGFEKMTKLMHALEDMLQKVKDKAITMTSSIVNILFESLDMLKSMKESIHDQKEDDRLDPFELIVKIQKMCGIDPIELEKEKKDKMIDSNKAIKINSADELVIEDSLARGQKVYIIDIINEEQAKMKSVKAFLIINNLKKIGQVLRTRPEDIENMNDEDFYNDFSVLFITVEDISTVREQIEVLSELKFVGIVNYIERDSQALKGKITPIKIVNNIKSNSDFRTEKRSTIKVDIKKLDKLMELMGELGIDKEKLVQIGNRLNERFKADKDIRELVKIIQHLDYIGTDIQESIMTARMYTVESIFNRFPRMVRDLAHKSGKEINFVTEGKETKLDRMIIEEIVDPIIHVLRNSVDHGIETKGERIQKGKSPEGNIVLIAKREENNLVIEVKDDGRGMDIEKIKQKIIQKGLATKQKLKYMSKSDILEHVFMPGFSTSDIVSELSGRGVGMDVVKTNIEKLNGFVEIATEREKGTTITMKLPLTLHERFMGSCSQ